MRAGIDLALPGRQRSGGGSSSPLPLSPAIDISFNAGLAWQNGVPYNSAASQITTVRASAGYSDDSAGNWILFGSNVPRITDKGLLVEEGRTNSIRNNSMQGAVVGVVGSGGVVPTNWTVSGPTGINRTIVGVGVVNGMDYIDINWSGTASGATTVLSIFMEATNSIAAASGQNWAASVFMQVLQNDPLVTILNATFVGTNGATATETFTSANLLPMPALIRASVIGLLANAGTTNVQSRITTNGIAAGQTVNFTLRIGWPQLEQGSFVTSPIRTTNAAVTRNQDFITVTNPPPYTGAGSFFGKFKKPVANSNTFNLIQWNMDGSNVVDIWRWSGDVGNIRGRSQVAAVNQADIVKPYSDGVATSQKAAFAYNTNDFSFSANGSVVVTDTLGTTSITPTSLRVGSSGAGSGAINGYVERITVFPTRLSNATLQSITGLATNPFPFSGAVLDLDFTSNAAYPADITKLLTTTRASLAWADDNSGNWIQFANNVPRITNKGLLVEEARTNSIRNNSMQGAAVGTPGTLPTNWIQTNNTGITPSVVGLGTENGIDYIDIRFVGTAVGSIINNIYFEPNTGLGIAAASGQTWTGSVFHKLVGGSLANINVSAIQLGVSGTNGTATITENFQGIGALTSSVWQRTARICPLANAGTTNLTMFFQIQATAAGVAIDLTIRFGWPQLELGASVTSPIRTTSAAVTRAYDSILTNVTLGAAYSMFASDVPTCPVTYPTNQALAGLNDGSANNRVQIHRAGATAISGGAIFNGGSNAGGPSFGSATPQLARAKVAAAFAAGDQGWSVNGGAAVAGAITPIPPVTSLVVGSTSPASLNGYVERMAAWNSRLTNAQLQALTRL